MNKKGFTLVELLAVVVVLGLVFAIAIPKVTSTMKDSDKRSFAIDAEMVLRSIDLKLSQGFEYDITTLNADTLKSVFGINNSNFKTITITMQGDIPYIVIEGKNKWNDLVAYGTQDEIVVKESSYYDVTPPVLSLTGASTVYVEQNGTYVELGATAIDNIDGNITNRINISGNIFSTATIGTTSVYYVVSDNAGNTSNTQRTVNILATAIPTVAFSMNGNSTYAKTRSTTVTVSDNVAVNLNSLEYQWTTSTTAPTEASFTTTFTNGATINSPAGVTGGYYLWILAKDIVGNTMIARSNVFNLDNTAQ